MFLYLVFLYLVFLYRIFPYLVFSPLFLPRVYTTRRLHWVQLRRWLGRVLELPLPARRDLHGRHRPLQLLLCPGILRVAVSDQRGRVSVLALPQQRHLPGRGGGLPVHLSAGLQRDWLPDWYPGGRTVMYVNNSKYTRHRRIKTLTDYFPFNYFAKGLPPPRSATHISMA